MTLKTNTIYCGDNLDILKGFEDESVDLCYIDPPFFTSKQYEVIWKDGAEIRAFEDRWAKAGDNGRYSKDISMYLDFIEPRLREIYRVLKPTGSFYLHCDWHIDGYLRTSCDQIFGYRNFRNCIVWKRTWGKKDNAKNYARNTDTILFYTKTDEYIFNPERIKNDEKWIEKQFPMVEASGRRFVPNKMFMPGEEPKSIVFKDRGKIEAPTGKRFVWNQETYDKRISENPHAIYWSNSSVPYSKRYMDEYQGTFPCNLWDDILAISPSGKERLGYPTQKPEALLERIIKASSKMGDVVLDAFCGCGTTLAVSRFLMRSWVGIDISPTACRTVASRIRYPFKDIIGLPMSAEDVAALTGYEFQNSVIRFLDPTLETIKVNNRGADGGIDGSYHGLLISVKKYKAGMKDLNDFVAVLYRNKRKRGIFIALDYTSDFTKEISRLGREQKIAVYAFTLADIIAEKHKNLTRKEDKAHGKL